MSARLPVVLYHSSVLVGVVREQIRLAPAASTWAPTIGAFPPATPGESRHDALAAARLSIPDQHGQRTLPAQVILARRSLHAAVEQVAEVVGRSRQQARAPEVAAGFAMTVVQEIGGCVAVDLTDRATSSEQDELAAQARVAATSVVVVASGRPPVVPGAAVVTPAEWRKQALLLLR